MVGWRDRGHRAVARRRRASGELPAETLSDGFDGANTVVGFLFYLFADRVNDLITMPSWLINQLIKLNKDHKDRTFHETFRLNHVNHIENSSTDFLKN